MLGRGLKEGYFHFFFLEWHASKTTYTRNGALGRLHIEVILKYMIVLKPNDAVTIVEFALDHLTPAIVIDIRTQFRLCTNPPTRALYKICCTKSKIKSVGSNLVVLL